MITRFMLTVVVWGKLCGAAIENANPYIASCSLQQLMAKAIVSQATDDDSQRKLFIESWQGYPFDVQKVLLAELLQQRVGYYRQSIHARYRKAESVRAVEVSPNMRLCAVAIANSSASYGGIITYDMSTGEQIGIKLHTLADKKPFKQLLFYPFEYMKDNQPYGLAAMTDNRVFLRSVTGAYSKTVLKRPKETLIDMQLSDDGTDIIVTSKDGASYVIDLIKEMSMSLTAKKTACVRVTEPFLELRTVLEPSGKLILMMHNCCVRQQKQSEYVTSLIISSKDMSYHMLPNAEGIIVKNGHVVVMYRPLYPAIAMMSADEIDCLKHGIKDWLQKKSWNVAEDGVAEKFQAIQMSHLLFSWLYNKELFTYSDTCLRHEIRS